MADWSPVTTRADVTVFTDHVADPDELVARLAPFDVVFVMRERTPLPRSVIDRLPRLRMIASTGPFNASIDMAAAEERGIRVGTTGGTIASTVELTWALILGAARHLVDETSIRRRRRLADDGRPRAGPPRARRTGAGPDRHADGHDRRGVRDGRDGVEYQPHARSRCRGGGSVGSPRRVLRDRRRPDRAPQAQRADHAIWWGAPNSTR